MLTMQNCRNFVTGLHQQTTRDYLARMIDNKIHCMDVACQFEEQYWDGDRRYGYGGYHLIPGRWRPVAEALIQEYQLDQTSSILDIGCGKAFLLHEIKLLIPEIKIIGIDVSQHAIECATSLVRENLIKFDARAKLPFANNEFSLVISLGALHNFRLPELALTIPEINRVGERSYIMVESYRNNAELFNLQCWALTAKSFLDPDEWIWLLNDRGYRGEFEFIFFE